jgi:hypothetical protein
MSKNATGTEAINAVNRVSHERMEDLIREAIAAKLNDPECELRIDEFDLAIRKDVGQPVMLDMTVFGMAGNTTKDEFCVAGQVVKGGGSIQVTLDDDMTVKFAFKEVVNLNATDYLVTYQLV